MEVLSQGPVRITKATIDASWRRRAKGVRLVLRDAECRGLALLVNATSMTWTYAYRPRGLDPHTGKRWPNQTVTLGNPSTLDPDAARRAAEAIKGQAAAGRDPLAEKRAATEAERKRRGQTLERLLDGYEKALPGRPKLRGTGLPSAGHVADEIAHARAAVAAMDAERRPVAELTAADVRAVLDAEASRPATARARYGALSRFLDWCQDAGHIAVNPCALVPRTRRPRAPQARSHFLALADLARLWRAAGELGNPAWRDLARLLVAIPCRRGEASALDWSHLNLAAAEWRQPGRLTKNGEAHRLHLHPLALDLLRDRHKTAGQPAAGLVFSSAITGNSFDSYTRMREALMRRSEVRGWTWHDFRRSFATALGEAGVSETVADAVLNHRQAATRGGVLGVYQRASRWPDQVRAMEMWGALLAEALHPKPGGTVVRLRRGRAA